MLSKKFFIEHRFLIKTFYIKIEEVIEYPTWSNINLEFWSLNKSNQRPIQSGNSTIGRTLKGPLKPLENWWPLIMRPEYRIKEAPRLIDSWFNRNKKGSERVTNKIRWKIEDRHEKLTRTDSINYYLHVLIRNELKENNEVLFWISISIFFLTIFKISRRAHRKDIKNIDIMIWSYQESRSLGKYLIVWSKITKKWL